MSIMCSHMSAVGITGVQAVGDNQLVSHGSWVSSVMGRITKRDPLSALCRMA